MNMLLRILLSFIVTILMGCEKKATYKDFSGHFVSDRQATISRWKNTQPWGDETKEKIKFLEPMLGSTEVITDGINYTVTSGDWEEKGKTEYISIDGATAVVKNYSTIWKRDIISRIEIDATGYWYYSDDLLEDYSERFTRKNEINQ